MSGGVTNGLVLGRRAQVSRGCQKVSASDSKMVDWVAVGISLIALFVGGFGAFRAYKAQEQSNHIEQENNSIAQKNIDLQKQLQAQSQAANERSAAQQIVLTTSPAELAPGQGVQGVTIDNGTHKEITNMDIVFTTGANAEIVDYSNAPSVLAPCSYLTLSFSSSFSPPADWNAWLYFTDADGNEWLTNLFGVLSKATPAPSGGQDLAGEIGIASSTLEFCGS